MPEKSEEADKDKNTTISQLAEDCCNRWFDNPAEGIVDIVIYPSVGITYQQLISLIKLNLPTESVDYKGIVAATDFNTMKLLDFTPGVKMSPDVPEVSLPSVTIREIDFQGPALFIGRPIEDTSNINIFSIIIPLLRLHRGSAIAWGSPIRQQYNGKTKELWTPLTITKPYQPNTDGPFDGLNMLQSLSTILTSLWSTTPMGYNRDRIIFSLELFSKASDLAEILTRVGVFHYWSAIEYLCDSNQESDLRDILFKDEPEEQPQLKKLFHDARIMRHNVIHKGHSPQSCPHILERYLQVVYLDMLYSLLNLPYQGYVRQFNAHHKTGWLDEAYKKNSSSK